MSGPKEGTRWRDPSGNVWDCHGTAGGFVQLTRKYKREGRYSSRNKRAWVPAHEVVVHFPVTLRTFHEVMKPETSE